MQETAPRSQKIGVWSAWRRRRIEGSPYFVLGVNAEQHQNLLSLFIFPPEEHETDCPRDIQTLARRIFSVWISQRVYSKNS
jgi:hypothetical protein